MVFVWKASYGHGHNPIQTSISHHLTEHGCDGLKRSAVYLTVCNCLKVPWLLVGKNLFGSQSVTNPDYCSQDPGYPGDQVSYSPADRYPGTLAERALRGARPTAWGRRAVMPSTGSRTGYICQDQQASSNVSSGSAQRQPLSQDHSNKVGSGNMWKSFELILRSSSPNDTSLSGQHRLWNWLFCWGFFCFVINIYKRSLEAITFYPLDYEEEWN